MRPISVALALEITGGNTIACVDHLPLILEIPH